MKVYSRKSVDTALKVAHAQLGWEPIYHSVEACDEAVGHFDLKISRYQDSGDFGPEALPGFDQDEIRWIQNERLLCQCDYMYFATRYAYILVSNEQMIHYQPNIAQLIANDARAQLQDKGWAIIMMFLKARQVGITTDSQTVIAHKTMFNPNVVALTGSSDKERSAEMVEKYRAIYDTIPIWLRPRLTVNRTGTRMVFGDQNSRLIIQHGAQKFDIGRGNTPTCFHLSEVASYVNAEDLIDAGLMPAIHDNPWIVGILESTGEGPFGWWYNTWQHSKKNYWSGRARFRPVFLPWFVARDFYPTATWIRRSPVPQDWRPEPVTVAHAERAKKFVRANDLLRTYYPEGWEMPVEQKWFWEVTREEYRSKKILSRFNHEFAADDLEAFMASGESVFDVDTISDYNASCREPMGVYGFKAPGGIIPGRLQADEHDVDHEKSPIEVGPYQLVPLKWTGWQTSNPLGRLLVFEFPEMGRDSQYGFGVDTADGVGLDNSVVEGVRKGTVTRNDAQVCELASPYINGQDLAPICHCIAMFYQGVQHKQPKIAIETGLNGELTQLELRKLGWSNIHNWVRYDRKKLNQNDSVRLGWVTNRWSRAMLIDCMVKALRDGSIDINSVEFVKEMQALHRDEWMAMTRAEQGQKDDRFMALGIIFMSLHILELTGRQQSVSYLRQKRHDTTPVLYREHYAGADEEVRLMDAASRPRQGVESQKGETTFSEYLGGPQLWHPGQESWSDEDYGG